MTVYYIVPGRASQERIKNGVSFLKHRNQQIHIAFPENDASFFFQFFRGHAVSGNQLAAEAAVIDQPTAAGGAFSLQQRRLAAVAPGQPQGRLRALPVLFRYVPALIADNSFPQPLAGVTGGGQAAGGFRADRD